MQLLKFITCGSVDDGKSTLIGHMLYDAKLIFADQQRALELDSKVGSADGKIDYALLLDGLMAEREQGITIDVAFRYFSTKNRSFIVADTPGHEEYTRNMAVGASFADLAVILVDASKGLLVQTKRHTRICALMGIRHLVFAINKMDKVDYDSDKFYQIRKDIRVMMADFEYDSLAIIPVSAKKGDNVTKKSANMAWYRGLSLLDHLERIDTEKTEDRNEGFVLPIQRVCRPNQDFRGFEGEVAHGEIKIGDEVEVLPSGQKANVSSILIAGRQEEVTSKGHPSTICLDKEIDISRGCVMVRDFELHTGSEFVADLLWMDEKNLVEGRNYFLKLGTFTCPATVSSINYLVDVNSGEHREAESLSKNSLASCDIMAGAPLVFSEFDTSRKLGSFILIDRITYSTAACGVIRMAKKDQRNLTYHRMDINRNLREEALNQKALTLWFTGLSGAGKSTVANALEARLFALGKHTMLLDGDNVRLGLNKNLGFTEADRSENIRRIAEVSKLLNDAGIMVISSFISPMVSDRRNAHEIIGDSFLEVYISTSLEECERRDVKGLYKKAKSGEISNFTGISSPYEVPEHPDISIDTQDKTVEESVNMIMEKLKETGYI